jgi:hypothetical protein
MWCRNSSLVFVFTLIFFISIALTWLTEWFEASCIVQGSQLYISYLHLLSSISRQHFCTLPCHWLPFLSNQRQFPLFIVIFIYIHINCFLVLHWLYINVKFYHEGHSTHITYSLWCYTCCKLKFWSHSNENNIRESAGEWV